MVLALQTLLIKPAYVNSSGRGEAASHLHARAASPKWARVYARHSGVAGR